MKKRRIIYLIIVTALLISTLFYFKWVYAPERLWEANTTKLYETLESSDHLNGRELSGEELAGAIPFEWDTVYSFGPYIPQEDIAAVIGISPQQVGEGVNEGINQVFFMKKGQVICYVYGYSEHDHLYFAFPPYEGSHIKMSLDEKLHCKLSKDNQGTWNLKFEVQ